MPKLFKILLLSIATTIAMGLTLTANAYCVYNVSNFKTITVVDRDKNLVNGRMGKREIAKNDSVCCSGNSRGCNKGARIQAVAPNTPSPLIYSSKGNNQQKNPANYSINCNKKVPAHGNLYIYGGITQPLRCTIE